MKKGILIFWIFIVMAMSMMSMDAKALGIAGGYLPNDTMEVGLGEEQMYTLWLQNVESQDTTVSTKIESELAGLASIIDKKDVYIVPANSTNTTIKLRITMPNNQSLLGKKFKIVFRATQENVSSTGGNIAFGVGIGYSFYVKAVQKEQSFNILYVAAPIAAVAAIAGGGYLYWSRKRKAKKKESSEIASAVYQNSCFQQDTK